MAAAGVRRAGVACVGPMGLLACRSGGDDRSRHRGGGRRRGTRAVALQGPPSEHHRRVDGGGDPSALAGGLDGPRRRRGRAHLDLLIDGLLRIYVVAPDGRSLTVRYLRRGDVAGVVSLFTPDYTTPGSIQALVDSEVLTLRARDVIDLSERDPRVARALIDELSERVVQFVAEIPGSAFSTVRQRVARHLLDLASEQHLGGRLVARISQQALADATGSVREVVVRVLRDLREEGVIGTGRGGIEVLLPDRLIVEQYPTWRSNAGHAAGPSDR